MSIDVRESPPIRRKENIPEDRRTEDRDKAADVIDEFLESGKWEDASKTSIADEAGYSRQHIDNVLKHYYEVVPEDGRDEDDTDATDNAQEPGQTTEPAESREDGGRRTESRRLVRGPGEDVIDFTNMSKSEIFSRAFSMGHDRGFDKGFERGRRISSS